MAKTVAADDLKLIVRAHTKALGEIEEAGLGSWMSSVLVPLARKFILRDHNARFLQAVQSIEAALGEKVDGGVVRVLKQRLCALLESWGFEKKVLGHAFEAIYKRRSQIVHGTVTRRSGDGGLSNRFPHEVLEYFPDGLQALLDAGDLARYTAHALMLYCTRASRLLRDHGETPERSTLLRALDFSHDEDRAALALTMAHLDGLLRVKASDAEIVEPE